MTFEAALENELKTISALNNRVYPFESPEKTYDMRSPYAIYINNEGLRDKTLNGYGTGKHVSGEINVVSPGYTAMKTITISVIDLIIGMEQREIGTGGPYIQELTYEKPVELWEDQPKLWRCVIEFEVYF